MNTTKLIDGQNDTDKPFNMGLARKLAKDVLYGLSRKHRRAQDEGKTFTNEDEEKYAMGKIYDGLLALKNHLVDKEVQRANEPRD